MKKNRGVLTFAEQHEGTIHPVSYELTGKGRELADKLGTKLYSVLLTGKETEARELIYRGADEVFYYEDPSFNLPNELVYEKNIVDLVREEKPEIFLVGATNFGRSLAPRIAASLDTGLTADCTGLEIDESGKLEQIRPAFSGNILAHIKSTKYPQMSTVRYKEFNEPPRDPSRKGRIIKKKAVVTGIDEVRVLEKEREKEVDITEARVVVSGGRGLRKREDFKLLKELADLLGGVVGSSRPLVDEGWISKDHQVGYSGNRVKPKVYIACGISGSSQHQFGMRESDIIVAINTDPSAPIFKISDYGIVGDIYEVVPMLIDLIRQSCP